MHAYYYQRGGGGSLLGGGGGYVKALLLLLLLLFNECIKKLSRDAVYGPEWSGVGGREKP